MSDKLLDISVIKKAQSNIKDVVVNTSFYQNTRYSELFECSVFLKREDPVSYTHLTLPTKA